MLSVRPALGTRFRHVVFTGSRSPGRVLNFAPAPRARISAGNEASHDFPRPTLSDPGDSRDAAFVQWLFAKGGLDSRAYRGETIRRRLNACLRALRVNSSSEARSLLDDRPDLIPVALNAIVIGVTSFFRDPAVFDQLTYQALPSMALNASKSPPRIWSVGCSSGEELYSIAILLAEMGVLDQSVLLGSDCRSNAVKQARTGCFDASSLKCVPSEWLSRYFIASFDKPRHNTLPRYQICKALRAVTQWRTADVTCVREPGAWDLILCRNMAMYLRPDVSGQLWEALEDSLRPGGYLVLGKAERPVGARRLTWIGPCIYRRTLG